MKWTRSIAEAPATESPGLWVFNTAIQSIGIGRPSKWAAREVKTCDVGKPEPQQMHVWTRAPLNGDSAERGNGVVARSTVPESASIHCSARSVMKKEGQRKGAYKHAISHQRHSLKQSLVHAA